MSELSLFETYMVFVAFASLTSWLPQLYKIHQTKSTDDFSLITTAILVWANGSFLAWALYNADVPLAIQQSLTVFMLFVFTYMILKYRTLPLWLRRKISVDENVNRDYPLSLDIETANLGDFDDLSTFNTSCVCIYDSKHDVDYIFVDDACYNKKDSLKHTVQPFSSLESHMSDWYSKGRYLLGHNTESFDFPILNLMGLQVLNDFQKEGRTIDTKKLLDEKYSLRVSLQNMVEGSIGDSKSMKGSDAPIFWSQEKYDEVISYCVKDTRLTYSVWKHGRKEGSITVKEIDLPIEW